MGTAIYTIIDVEGIKYRYKLVKLFGNSQKYGHCERCKKFVDDVYLQTEEREYTVHIPAERVGFTHSGCHTFFGHEQCLINYRKKGNVLTLL